MGPKRFQRKTQQRVVIQEELQKLTSHPTAAELYQLVRRRLPRVSLGTVYRNLELLAQMDLIQKLEISGAEARYDGNPARHAHIRCVRCRRVDDLPELPDDPVGGDSQGMAGYDVLGYRLEFFGVCPTCRPRAENEPSPPSES